MQNEAAELLRRLFRGQEASWPEQAGLPAEAVFYAASAQGLAPLLLRVLTEHGPAGWPPELLARLRETTLRQAAAELRLEADLRALLQAFAAAGIRPLLLKGTPLAHTLYPEPWLRPRCDTDLLVAEPEREKAAALLLRLGYAPLVAAEAEYLGAQMSYAKTAQGVRCSYDLHWQISNANRQFSARFSASLLPAAAVPALGAHAWTLSRPDALLYACFHRAGHFSHSGERLIWLHDIHLLCQALSSQEAETFCARAGELEITALCADALAAAQSWFGTALAPPLAALMQAKTEGGAFAVLLTPGGREVGIRNHALLELKGLPNWRERLRFLLHRAFPPPTYMLWRYDRTEKSALPLLYLRRFAEAVSIFLRR